MHHHPHSAFVVYGDIHLRNLIRTRPLPQPAPKMLQRLIEFVGDNRTALDIDHIMTARPVKPHDETLVRPPALELSPAAISPFVRRRHQRPK